MHGVDLNLRKDSAGFRQRRRMTEEIFVLRSIVGQEFKWNFSLCECFIDYEKAFGAVYR